MNLYHYSIYKTKEYDQIVIRIKYLQRIPKF